MYCKCWEANYKTVYVKGNHGQILFGFVINQYSLHIWLFGKKVVFFRNSLKSAIKTLSK